MRVLHDTSRAAEARALDERATELLGRHVVQENVNLYTTLLRSSAMHALEAGRLDAATSTSADLVKKMRDFTGSSISLATALQQYSRSVAAQGRIDDARSSLDEAFAMAHVSLGPHALPVAFASMQIDRAALELWSGNPAAALSGLDAVATVVTASPSGSGPLVPQIAKWRAAALRQAGRAGEAVRAAQTGLDALEAKFRPIDLPRLRADLLLEQGLAFHATGQFSRARENLTQALSLRRENDDVASVWLAEVQIGLAECLAQFGRRDECRALLDEAQQIHAQHAQFAPHLAAAMKNAVQAVEAG
jgi:tetratricopeptide (TPR) repeat protein